VKLLLLLLLRELVYAAAYDTMPLWLIDERQWLVAWDSSRVFYKAVELLLQLLEC